MSGPRKPSSLWQDGRRPRYASRLPGEPIPPEAKPMEFPIRTVTCACGGRFTAGGHSAVVASAIDAHNATARHQAWRKEREDA